MCIPMQFLDIAFYLSCITIVIWTFWAFREKGPTFTDIDLMFKYGVEYPELKRMKKAGLV